MGKIDYNQGSRHNDYSSVLDSDSFAETDSIRTDSSIVTKPCDNFNCVV